MKSDSEITDKCQPHLFIVSSKWERQWRRRVNLLCKIHCPNLPATCRLSEMLTQVWQGCLIYEQLKGGGKKGRRIKHYKSMSNIHNPEVLVVNNTKRQPNFYKCNLWQAIPSKWENLKGKKSHLLEYHYSIRWELSQPLFLMVENFTGANCSSVVPLRVSALRPVGAGGEPGWKWEQWGHGQILSSAQSLVQHWVPPYLAGNLLPGVLLALP